MPAARCVLAAASMETSPYSQNLVLCCGLAGIVFSPLALATEMSNLTMTAGCLPS